ncbi:MAG: bifunctional adenosylcobinamide kinase/adenosylcobinamide-phosphate guanylyltransferase [Haloechinothrix sp.]
MPGMSHPSVRRTLAGVLHRGARTFDRIAATVRPPRRVLVLGGARSGKSRHAERLLARYPEVVYVATGNAPCPEDAEWAERVRLHQRRRPAQWRTVETGDAAAALREAQGPVLLDCLATWITRVLDDAGAWDEAAGWQQRVEHEVSALLAAWRETQGPVVAVSNEVGSGVVPATPAGRLFRDVLGSLNSRIAEESDSVLLVVAGRALELAR